MPVAGLPSNASLYGGLAAAVPGELHGLADIHTRYEYQLSCDHNYRFHSGPLAVAVITAAINVKAQF